VWCAKNYLVAIELGVKGNFIVFHAGLKALLKLGTNNNHTFKEREMSYHDLSHHHERIVCELCSAIISQCRCIEPKKDIPKGLCEECKLVRGLK